MTWWFGDIIAFNSIIIIKTNAAIWILLKVSHKCTHYWVFCNLDIKFCLWMIPPFILCLTCSIASEAAGIPRGVCMVIWSSTQYCPSLASQPSAGRESSSNALKHFPWWVSHTVLSNQFSSPRLCRLSLWPRGLGSRHNQENRWSC